MVQHRKFMDLALDDDGLHTPDGYSSGDATWASRFVGSPDAAGTYCEPAQAPTPASR